MDVQHILVGGLVLATLAVLAVGVTLMVGGGKANAKFGNKLMVMRVVLQGLVLLVIGVIFAAKQ